MDNLGWIVCSIVFVVVVFAILVANRRAADAANASLRIASDAYQGALSELKAVPTNPDLKQRALELGRTYSNLTRQSKGVTVYDEMALANDISAATAGASASTVAATVQERLKRLDDLRAAGAITDAEHTAQRQKILEGL